MSVWTRTARGRHRHGPSPRPHSARTRSSFGSDSDSGEEEAALYVNFYAECKKMPDPVEALRNYDPSGGRHFLDIEVDANGGLLKIFQRDSAFRRHLDGRLEKVLRIGHLSTLPFYVVYNLTMLTYMNYYILQQLMQDLRGDVPTTVDEFNTGGEFVSDTTEQIVNNVSVLVVCYEMSMALFLVCKAFWSIGAMYRYARKHRLGAEEGEIAETLLTYDFHFWEWHMALFTENLSDLQRFSAVQNIFYAHPSVFMPAWNVAMKRKHRRCWHVFRLLMTTVLAFVCGFLAFCWRVLQVGWTFRAQKGFRVWFTMFGFFFQMFNMVDINKVMKQRLFVFAFGGSDAQFSPDESERKNAYLVSVYDAIWQALVVEEEGSWITALAVQYTFNDVDLQKLLITENNHKLVKCRSCDAAYYWERGGGGLVRFDEDGHRTTPRTRLLP